MMIADVRNEASRAVLCVATTAAVVLCPGLARSEQAYPDEIDRVPTDGQEPFAQPDEGDDAPEAVALFETAQEMYDTGRYQEAVGYLLQILEIDPDAPDIYYNLALAYEHLTEYDRALEFLDRYRRFDIGAEEQQRVERMITRIRGARDHAPQGQEPETRTQVVVRRFGRADGWFWAMVGTTVLLAGGAAVTGGFALNWGNAADRFVLGPDGDLDEHQRWIDVADTLALATDILIGTASATALTALLLYVLRTHESVDELDTATHDDRRLAGESDRSPDGEDDRVETSRLGQARSSTRCRLVPGVRIGLGAATMSWEW